MGRISHHLSGEPVKSNTAEAAHVASTLSPKASRTASESADDDIDEAKSAKPRGASK